MSLPQLEILEAFKSISLAEMDEVALMRRIDTKYMFHKDLLDEILFELRDQYDVLKIEDSLIMAYQSDYYDTPDFDLFQNHQRGKLNRYKFRFRNYLITNTLFFEIKFKNNKGRTNKIRRQIENLQNEFSEIKGFLSENAPFSWNNLEEKLRINYSRITLVDKKRTERVTLDLNMEFIHGENSKRIEYAVIAEVKQLRLHQSAFAEAMKKRRIRIGSISKYCQGVFHLYPDLKNNNFKRFNLQLLKLSKESNL